MYISKSTILSSGSSLLIWSLRWKRGATPRWAAKQNGFHFSWLLSSSVWKGTLLHITMLLLFRLSQLCQVVEFCLVRKATIPSWYYSAFRQLLAELMHCCFHSVNWNSSRTFKSFVSLSTCLCSTQMPGSRRFVGQLLASSVVESWAVLCLDGVSQTFG